MSVDFDGSNPVNQAGNDFMDKLIVGNLKMNLVTPADRERYITGLKNNIKRFEYSKNTKIVLCVPFVHLEPFSKALAKNKRIFIGSQNCFWEKKGSFTGEVSPEMVKATGGTFVIIGHSERRRYLRESSEECNLKLRAALKAKLEPIYCVGETMDERRSGIAAKIILRQTEEGLKDIDERQMGKVAIAYEPVWSVGTDAVPTVNEIMEAKLLIRKFLTEKYGSAVAQRVRVIYGGSVSPALAKAVCVDPGMDGVLVGRGSLVSRELLKIADIISKS